MKKYCLNFWDVLVSQIVLDENICPNTDIFEFMKILLILQWLWEELNFNIHKYFWQPFKFLCKILKPFKYEVLQAQYSSFFFLGGGDAFMQDNNF